MNATSLDYATEPTRAPGSDPAVGYEDEPRESSAEPASEPRPETPATSLRRPETLFRFLLAGRAEISLRHRDHKPLRFRVDVSKVPTQGRTSVPAFFVSTRHLGRWTYLGTIFRYAANTLADREPGLAFRYTERSFKDERSRAAWDFLWNRIMRGRALPEAIEIEHSGTCGRCGRELTDPESIARGVGPTCIKYVSRTQLTDAHAYRQFAAQNPPETRDQTPVANPTRGPISAALLPASGQIVVVFDRDDLADIVAGEMTDERMRKLRTAAAVVLRPETER